MVGHTAIDTPSLEQQAPGDQRHGQISKIEENATLYCASAGLHAIPVPTALARDDVSEPLDMKAQVSLEALPEAAHNDLKGYEVVSSRKDELFTATATPRRRIEGIAK
jgi:hypothetical protein